MSVKVRRIPRGVSIMLTGRAAQGWIIAVTGIILLVSLAADVFGLVQIARGRPAEVWGPFLLGSLALGWWLDRWLWRLIRLAP